MAEKVLVGVNIGNATENLRGFEHADGTTSVIGAVSGERLEEPKSNTDAVGNVITFGDELHAVEIYHEAATWQTFTVNGLTIKVPAGGYRSLIGGTPGLTVTIPSGLACIVNRLA